MLGHKQYSLVGAALDQSDIRQAAVLPIDCDVRQIGEPVQMGGCHRERARYEYSVQASVVY